MSTRKKNLREFQQRLSDRLRLATSTPVRRMARLGVQVGERRMLVDLAEAGEVLSIPPNVASVPLTREWFRGLVNVRGALFAVCDLARFGGGAFTPANREARLLAFSPRLGMNGALLVARIFGLKDVESMQASAPEPARTARDESGAALSPSGSRPDWLGAEWVDAEGLHWTELSLSKLAADDRFRSIGR